MTIIFKKSSKIAGIAAFAAKKYRSRGWRVLPIPHKSKACHVKDWPNYVVEDEALSSDFKDPRNVAVLLGGSQLTDIDVDSPDATPFLSWLPPTQAVWGRESNPKSHHLYKGERPSRSYKNSTGAIIEIRSGGCYAVLPPSTHPSSESYCWTTDQDPGLGEDLEGAVLKIALAATLLPRWKPGRRHHLSLCIAGLLLKAGWLADDVQALIMRVAEVAGDDDIEDRIEAIQTTLQGMKNGTPVSGFHKLSDLIGDDAKVMKSWVHGQSKDTGADGAQAARCTDVGNALRFVRDHGDCTRYCRDYRKWLFRAGHRWRLDEDGEVMRRARQTARNILDEASQDDGPARSALAKHAIQSESLGRLNAMVELAKSEPTIPVLHEDLDADPWLLGVSNGVVDLRTGALVDSQPQDYITKAARVSFDPAAECPAFLTFLDQIFESKASLIAFVQRAVGYGLTGFTSEECLFLLHGSGANGKTTLMNAIRTLAGDYGMQCAPETLMTKKNSGIPNDIARLKGARLVATSEVEAGQRFSESLVKQLTGRDKIVARFMRAEFFEFVPQFKIFLAANHKPVIRGTDYAIWRRIKLIPFNVTIPKEKQDPHLAGKLQDELPGIRRCPVAC
jgi:P4 family phage/plasmid primase-like protien